MPRKSKDEIPVYACYWTDAQKSDDPEGENHVRPIHAITFGYLLDAQEDSLALAAEIFEDQTKRGTTAIHATAIEKIVKIGTIPSFKKVFGKPKKR